MYCAGQGWCDQRTGMDADNLPKPYSMFDMGSGKHPPPPNVVPHVEVPQSLPASSAARMQQPAQFNPSQSGRELNSSQSGRELNPSQSEREFNPRREFNPSHSVTDFERPAMARNDPPQRPLRAGGGEVGGGAFVQGGTDGGRDIPSMSRYDMGYQGDVGHGRGNPNPYSGGRGESPGGRYEDNWFGGSGGFAISPNNRGFGGGGPSGVFAGGPTADYRRAGAYNEYNGGGRGNPAYDGQYTGGVDERSERGGSFHGEVYRGGMYGHHPQRRDNLPGPRRAWEDDGGPSPGQNSRPLQPQVARPPHIKLADLREF